MRPARFLLNEVKSVKKETFYGILKLIKIDPIKVDVNHDNPGSNLPQMMLKPMFISTETLTNPTERSLFFDSITSSGSSFVFVKQKDLNLLTDVDPQFSQQYLLSDAQNANQRQTNTGDSLITTTLNNNHNNNNNSMVAFKNLPTMTLKSILENSSLSKDSSKNDTPPALPEKQGIQKNEEAFLEAVLFGDEEKVETFLFGNSNQKNGQEEKINKDYLNLHHPLHGGTPLHLAASNGHVNLVKLFLGSGADVNARAFNGSTPLHWAMKHDTMSESQAVVRMLLKHGADVQAATYTWKSTVHGTASGQTPAHWASDFGNHFLLDLLLDHSIEAIGAKDDRRQTPLALVAKKGDLDTQDFISAKQNEKYVCLKISVQQIFGKSFSNERFGKKSGAEHISLTENHVSNE